MKDCRSRAGFTLVELLMAVVITVAIAAVMIAVANGALSIWRKAQDNFTADTEAQLILDFIERDLRGAIFRLDGNTWLQCQTFDNDLGSHGWVTAGATMIKPAVVQFVPAGASPSLADARFSRSGYWLRFFTTTGGEPIAVGYQIVRRSFSGASTPDPETIRYSLFRRTITPENTFSAGYDLASHADLTKPETSYNAGSNVIDFGIWFYRTGSNGSTIRIFPVAGETSFSVVNTEAPTHADVMVRILTEEGAAEISAIERGLAAMPEEFKGDSAAWWWSVAQTHSRVYVRRVRIGSLAL
jgi:hypothetical protein